MIRRWGSMGAERKRRPKHKARPPSMDGQGPGYEWPGRLNAYAVASIRAIVQKLKWPAKLAFNLTGLNDQGGGKANLAAQVMNGTLGEPSPGDLLDQKPRAEGTQ
jgi:hypothetical protein